MYNLIFNSDRNHGHRVTSVVITEVSAKQLDNGEKGKFIAEGIVTRHNADQDDKLVAQKYALTKALKNTKLDKEKRRQVWTSFFLRSKRARKLIGVKN